MSTDPDLTAILADLAAGRIDPAEAAARIGSARPASDAPGPPSSESAAPEPAEPEPAWKAYAREELHAPAAQPAASAADPEPQSEPQPEPQARPEPGRPAPPRERPAQPPRPPREEPREQPAGAQGAGAQRVSIRSVGRRVRVLGDASVATVAVTGPHTLRRSGTVLEVAAEGAGRPLEGFNLLKLPRSLDDLRGLGLGAELLVRVNPALVVDAEVTASGLATEGVPRLGRVRVTAGGASLRDVRQAADVLVQAGSASVEGPIGEGRSRVKCESGALTVVLTPGANVTVRGQASFGRVAWPGDAAEVDEWVVGAGSGRLDLEIVMGLATVRDAGSDAGGASSGPARTAAEGTCPECGAEASGRFCSSCGAKLPGGRCQHCGQELPAGARFCPGCGAPA